MWYVLDPEGTNMTDLIYAGPFATRDEAYLIDWTKHGLEVHDLDENKIEAALDTERRLQERLSHGANPYR